MKICLSVRNMEVLKFGVILVLRKRQIYIEYVTSNKMIDKRSVI